MDDEYQILVLFKRNRKDDEEDYGKTDHDLMAGLAKELQDGYDLASISGDFQVQCVVRDVL